MRKFDYQYNALESSRLQRDAYDVTLNGTPIAGLCALSKRDAEAQVSAKIKGDDVEFQDADLYQAERDE